MSPVICNKQYLGNYVRDVYEVWLSPFTMLNYAEQPFEREINIAPLRITDLDMNPQLDIRTMCLYLPSYLTYQPIHLSGAGENLLRLTKG